MSKDDTPTIFKVAPGAKIGKFEIEDSHFEGKMTILDNEGDIDDMSFERNRVIILPKLKALAAAIKKPSANGNEGWKIMFVGCFIATILTLVSWVSYDFYIKPSIEAALAQPEQDQASE